MYKKRIPVGELCTNCYLIMDEETKEAIIVDPGEESSRIIKEVNKAEAKIKYILLTHGHFDHTGAAIELSLKYDVSIFINKLDQALIEKKDSIFIMNNYDPKNLKTINKNIELLIGSKRIECIETPGHSPGGMCYKIDDLLISGDSLFKSSIGRTDFKDGSYEVLLDSIRKKLFNLNDDTEVLPGHGLETTIGYEKRNNPFFR